MHESLNRLAFDVYNEKRRVFIDPQNIQLAHEGEPFPGTVFYEKTDRTLRPFTGGNMTAEQMSKALEEEDAFGGPPLLTTVFLADREQPIIVEANFDHVEAHIKEMKEMKNFVSMSGACMDSAIVNAVFVDGIYIDDHATKIAGAEVCRVKFQNSLILLTNHPYERLGQIFSRAFKALGDFHYIIPTSPGPLSRQSLLLNKAP